MNADVRKKIITLCLQIDTLAVKIYQTLAANADSELQEVWREMEADEKTHVLYWRKLLDWSEKGMLPRLFDAESSTLSELSSILSRCKEILASCMEVNEKSKAFLIAFKLEFYLLHPAFETLFVYIKTISKEDTAEQDYEVHISRLFAALKKYGMASLELELLGETIYRIWEENKKMAVLSNYDHLTGILNRRGLFNAISPLSHLAQRNNTAVAIMMIDIDNFKLINDQFGHQFGDTVLKYVASTINANIRASDILGRYGGEEFLIYLSTVSPDSLANVGEKVLKAIETNFQQKARVSVSIGIAFGNISKNVNSDLELLIKEADAKLYEAKNTGKNKVVS